MISLSFLNVMTIAQIGIAVGIWIAYLSIRLVDAGWIE